MLRNLLIIILLLYSLPVRAQTPAPVVDGLAVPDGVRVRRLTPQELKGFRDSDSYTFVEAETLQKLLKRGAAARQPSKASVHRSEYSAVLKNRSLQNGQLVLELETSEGTARNPVSLGRTNLNNLRLFSQELALTLATDSNGNLIPLIPPTSERITGTWEANSTLVGKTTVFQLTLPASAVAVFRLRTDSDIVVTSSNALVVPAEKAERHTDWILYPGNPADLTISCIKRDDANGQGELSLVVATRVRVDTYASTIQWEVGLPTVLSNARTAFRISQLCDVHSVRVGTLANSEWTVEDNGRLLSVELPEMPSASTMVIQASIERASLRELKVPFLMPDSWRSRFGESGGNTRLKPGQLRMTVSPDLTVADLQLNGLLERDVSYAADGFQTLEFSQFSAEASATAHITPATPVVDDSVVIRPSSGDDSGQATAFVYLKARTGSLGRVRWQVPANWQVTAVTEMDSDLPLLFRTKESSRDSVTNDVDVFLRSPVGGESGQAIEIRLQSTDRETAVAGSLPEFRSAQYRRQLDLVCFETSAPPDALTRTDIDTLTSLATESLQKKAPWLASDEFEGATFFERSELEDTFRVIEDSNYVYDAMLDYSVSENDGLVTESNRLRIRAIQELPQRLSLRVTSDSNLKISQASAPQPPLPLTKQTTGPVFDLWTLDIPAASVADDIDITLISRRSLQDQMPATMLEVVDARQMSGTVQPPDGIFELILSDTAPVMQSEPYPASPFDEPWTLYKSLSTVPRMELSSTAFVLLTRTPSGLLAEVMQRMVVGPNANRSVLTCRLPLDSIPVVLIEGKPVFAERDGPMLQIPMGGQTESSEVTFLYQFAPEQSRDPRWRIPLVTLPDASSTTSFSFVLPPKHAQPESRRPAYVRPVREATERLEEAVSEFVPSEISGPMSSFLARWKLASLNSTEVFCTDSGADDGTLTLRLEDHRFALPVTILWATSVFLSWLIVDRRRSVLRWWPVGALLIAPLLMLRGELASSSLLVGIVAGTILFAALRVCCALWQRHRSIEVLHGRRVALRMTAFLLSVVCSQVALSQNNTVRPEILVPSTEDRTVPFAYVDNNYLKKLQAVDAGGNQGCYVVSSVVSVRMESPRSCVAKVRSDVAVLPGKGGSLTIPLNGMTLVSCLVGDAAVFPERGPNGEIQVAISGDTILPERTLDERTQSPMSDGPASLGRWEIHSVEYNVRAVPRRSPQDYRLTVQFPPSSQTVVEFEDASGLVEQVAIPSAVDTAAIKVEGATCRFPAVFNAQSVELALQIRNPDNAEAEKQQTSALMCVADITPTQQRLTCEYQVRPTDSRSEKIIIGTDTRYRITGVQSTEGESLAWTMDGSNLVVDRTPGESGLQTIVVRLLFDPPIGLIHQISIGGLSLVNGIRTDSTWLIPRTSEQFVVNSVVDGASTEGQPLEETPIDAEVRTFQVVRSEGTVISIPATTAAVSVELAELQATRVARLAQKVVVRNDAVDWTFKCEVDVTGQPVFRQSLQISDDVRINNVTAASGGVSRLKSWTRHDDQLVISLREGTRGLLEIVVDGTLPRPSGTDLKLPIALLPQSIEITESDLEISADAETDTFIASLGAAVPVDLIDIDNAALTSTPISLSIGDESEPIVIRGNPEKKIATELIVLLYDADGETRYAQFLAIKTPGVAFDIRFRCPPADFGNETPIVVRNGEPQKCDTSDGDYLIPRISSQLAASTPEAARLTLAIPSVSPTREGDQVLFPVPAFDANVEVTACRAYDLRATEPSSAEQVSVPEWATDAAVYANVADDVTRAVVVESQFAVESRSVVLRPELSAPSNGPTTETPSVLLSHAQHLLKFSGDGSVSGTTAFLVFRSQSGSSVTIQIPDESAVANVSINGSAHVFRIVDGTITLNPSDRIANIRVAWLRQFSQAVGQTEYAVALPKLQAAQASQQAVVVPPASRSRWWRLLNPTTSRIAFRSTHQDAMSQGLRLLGGPATGRDTTGSAVDDSDDDIDRVWTSVAAESQVAAEVARRFAEHLKSALDGGALTVKLTGPEPIEIASPVFPAPIAGVSLLAALLLIVSPWYLRKSETRSDGSETKPDGQMTVTKPTIADSNVLGPADSKSHSGFLQ